MNKFEKLIEYIINDEDQKARELFHDIVVEKSRDIYESIMANEEFEEEGQHASDDQVGNLVHEIGTEESAMGEAEGEEEMGGEEEFGGEEPAEHGEHAEIEDQVMNIDAKLDELLAKFDEIMGDEAHGEEMPAEEPGMEQGEEEGMMEGENPFASGKSGKSGSGSAASGKSGSAKMEAAKAGSAVSGKSGSAASGKSGSAASGKSGAEIMKEYVNKIKDMNLSGETEGTSVGAAGKNVSVNKKSGSVGPGADFGGTNANIVNGKGDNEAPDGKAIPKPSNEYSKGEGKLIGKVGNSVGGGNEKQKSTGDEYSKEHPADGMAVGNDGKLSQNHKSVQKQNTGIKK